MKKWGFPLIALGVIEIAVVVSYALVQIGQPAPPPTGLRLWWSQTAGSTVLLEDDWVAKKGRRKARDARAIETAWEQSILGVVVVAGGIVMVFVGSGKKTSA